MPRDPAQTAALITLLRTGKRPWAEYVERVEEAGSATEVLAEDAGLLVPDTTRARDDIGRWEADRLRLLTVLDPDYPENLRAVHDRPPLIFVAGELRPRDGRSIAVIGGRKPGRSGLLMAVEIARHLTAEGFTVISGLASGIDSAAHRAALEAGGRTIAVIGTGTEHAYPPENAGLQNEIAQRSAVVSQFWPDARPVRASFPLRNAVMSGLALATVIVDASATSGTRTQARAALRHGRPVFLLEPLVHRQAWAGALADNPATHVVNRPHEIVEIIDRLTSSDPLVA